MTHRFESIVNFRDYGGYASNLGGRVATGRLLRCGHLGDVSDQDMPELEKFGLSAVVDLRSRFEQAKKPSRLPEGQAIRRINSTIEAVTAVHVDVESDRLTLNYARAFVQEFYRSYPERIDFVTLLREYFAALAEADGPVLIHCTAGKDRTGMTAALTLHLLGVEHDTIIEDYMLTMKAVPALMNSEAAYFIRRRWGEALTEETLGAFMGVHPSYLNAALEAIEIEHGSLWNYLTGPVGVTSTMAEQIRARLIVG